ncbi:glycine/D-amino acid oxidase-like deaminating enzyme [Rhodothalassium salexigens DSM 2132]|uniref:Glycine/D-amino acid oxidase-like deaminating enzyme n=1 Tax=Rhodothalassium salexigens DSM 2132 TaxID=1188247 RepID=A0A4R2PRH6_RHOSA|nr:FAD-dependent oxidoreductase [Rhodothalassium salexigens]MBB4210308.1 glycine/D-amino acid oxidase-like deaminating enzyme [Rhodothalassium salexigens DSM 2132]MBK1639217.1 hypothetical protein [Rhodothalassium salexigens DSM 2132]TCP38472.1 glycine/D-amino acid oxidase-like deaminating enzyme [Rhodothalassium salexigens DSM 2132]
MSYDVAIIGGGLAGTAAAYYLTGHGLTPAVLEAGELNAEASGANAGSLHFQLEHRLIAHGDALAQQVAAIIPLAKRAMALWRGLETELRAPLDVVMDGGLMLAETPEDMARLEAKQAVEARWGLDTQMLDQAQVRARLPGVADTVLGAAHCADEGHANPRLTTLAYARRAAERGARFFPHARVTATERRAGAWSLTLADGRRIRARVLVNAAGAWARDVGQLANVHIPIVPVALQMTVTEPVAPRLGHLIQHAGKALSMKQVEAGNILVGGGWPARLGDPGRRPRAFPRTIARNLATACGVWPELGRLALLRTWTGTVGVSTDQLPLIGRLSALPDYYVVGAGSGFTLGPAFAATLADQIATGRSDPQATVYSPDRFAHLNMFMGL